MDEYEANKKLNDTLLNLLNSEGNAIVITVAV